MLSWKKEIQIGRNGNYHKIPADHFMICRNVSFLSKSAIDFKLLVPCGVLAFSCQGYCKTLHNKNLLYLPSSYGEKDVFDEKFEIEVLIISLDVRFFMVIRDKNG